MPVTALELCLLRQDLQWVPSTGSCTRQSCRSRRAACPPQKLPRPWFGAGSPREQLHLLAGCDGEHPGTGAPARGQREEGTGSSTSSDSSLCSCCSLWQGCTGLEPAGALTPAHNQLGEQQVGCSQVTLLCKAISKQNESRQ